MAEVEFNGSQGTVPDFALEDTQEKILATLKKAFNLDQKDILNAQKALQNDNKNSKAQLEAFKDLGKDIQAAVDGKGTFFGSLTSGVTATAGVLGTLGKAGGALATGIIGLGSAVSAGIISLTKGFGDDLKNAGLAESGAAFGSLGKELNVVIPGMMSLGLSIDQAAGVINDFRSAMTLTSGTAIQGVINEFQNLTNGGAAYGRTISENIEYLSEELEYRARQGFIDDRNRAQAAADAKEIMDSQINASKLLGKSVDEIANGVKDLFSGDIDIAASLATLGPEVEKELRKTFQTFEGAGLPKSFQAGLAKMLTDPIMLGSQEARDAFNAISVLPDGMGDKVQSQIETLRAAMEMPEGADRTNAIAQANKDLEHSMLEMGSNISKLSQTEKEALFIQGQSIPFLRDLLASQRGFAAAFENYNDSTNNELNKSLENSVQFDNQITMLRNTFGVLVASVKSGIAPALEMFTKALGSMADSESPISKFRVRLEDISKKIIDRFQAIFGMTTDQEKNTNVVNSLLEKLGNFVAYTADSLMGFVESLMANDGVSFVDKIMNFFLNDIVYPLGNAISQWWQGVDLWDLLFGDSDKELVGEASQRVDKINNPVNPNIVVSEEEKSSKLMNAVANIVETSRDRGYEADKLAGMIKEAGVELQDLTGEHMLELFPDPADLQKAITEVYANDSEALYNATKKIVDYTNAEAENYEKGPNWLLRSNDKRKALADEQRAVAQDFLSAIEEKTPEEKTTQPAIPREEIVKEQKPEQTTQPTDPTSPSIDKKLANLKSAQGQFLSQQMEGELGRQPTQSPSNSIITSMPTDESTENADSDNLTKKQESDGASDITGANSNGSLTNKEFAKMIGQEISTQLIPALQNIDKNTKKGASATSAVAANTQ